MKNNKAITLIALVITIIVLLILAGITVAQLSGNNLFENAKLAKEKYKKSRELEDDILGDYEDAITGDRANNNNYSIEEQVIGKWINNKDIYRKVIDFSVSGNSSYNATKKILENTDIDEIINKGGWVKNSGNYYYSIGKYIQIYIDPSNNLFLMNDLSSETITGRLIIEYTKK